VDLIIPNRAIGLSFLAIGASPLGANRLAVAMYQGSVGGSRPSRTGSPKACDSSALCCLFQARDRASTPLPEEFAERAQSIGVLEFAFHLRPEAFREFDLLDTVVTTAEVYAGFNYHPPLQGKELDLVAWQRKEARTVRSW
jgi:hypothetical protein